MLEDNSIDFIIYILLGGSRDHHQDLEDLKKIIKSYSPQNIITSIWAYNLDADYKYDTHFSPISLKRWNLDKETYFNFLSLQNSNNLTVGNILNE